MTYKKNIQLELEKNSSSFFICLMCHNFAVLTPFYECSKIATLKGVII